MNKDQEYRKRSDRWDLSAGVRVSRENFDLQLSNERAEKIENLSWHLPAYSAILNHSTLKNLSNQQKEYIKGTQLLEFVTKQTLFEIECVNYVAARLAHDKYPFKISEALKIDALKIYTDEGYHAYYTQKMAFQIKEYYGIDHNVVEDIVKKYYEKIYSSILKYGEKNKELCMLAFVIAGENQIVADISAEMKNIVYPPIRALFREHMQDEIFHAKFFQKVFMEIWEQIDKEQRNIMGKFLCDSFEILAIPRTDIYYFSLGVLGFQSDTIQQMISEVYNNETWGVTRVKDRILPTISFLNENRFFEEEEVKDYFNNKGYL